MKLNGHINIKRINLDALIIEVGDHTEPDIALQKEIWGLDHNIRCWPEVLDVVPGVNNLLIKVKHAESIDHFIVKLKSFIAESDRDLIIPKGRSHKFLVSYGGPGGPDLAAAAKFCGFSIDDFVLKHASAKYTVFCLGAHPGFGYLGGLPKALRIPRLETPRPSVAAGSVAIGGTQAGIIASSLASGWRLIGCTDTKLFSINDDPPALLAPGDSIEFDIKEVLG